MCGEGGQSCLGRSASCPEVPGLSVFARTAIAAQKSAEGMVVGTPTKARTAARTSLRRNPLPASSSEISTHEAKHACTRSGQRPSDGRSTHATYRRTHAARPHLQHHLRPYRKQRHTAKRIFERLRDEHGFTGGYTIVGLRCEHRRRRREMFVPLTHPPAHAAVQRISLALPHRGPVRAPRQGQ